MSQMHKMRMWEGRPKERSAQGNLWLTGVGPEDWELLTILGTEACSCHQAHTCSGCGRPCTQSSFLLIPPQGSPSQALRLPLPQHTVTHVHSLSPFFPWMSRAPRLTDRMQPVHPSILTTNNWALALTKKARSPAPPESRIPDYDRLLSTPFTN